MTPLIAAAAILLANDCFAPTTDGWERLGPKVLTGSKYTAFKKQEPMPRSAVEYHEMGLAEAKKDAARMKKCAEAIKELEVQVEISRREKTKWKR